MKLILAIIQASDEFDTVEELNAHGFFVTKLSTSGGFLKARNVTLLVGTEDEKVGKVTDIIRERAGKRLADSAFTTSDSRMFPVSGPNMVKLPAGGATVFVMDIDQFMKF
jgi:Uncharacterized protein conserved in bacteria